MDGRKPLTFGPEQAKPITNNSPLTASANYTDLIDKTFGQLYIHPVGHSSPGTVVGDSILSNKIYLSGMP